MCYAALLKSTGQNDAARRPLDVLTANRETETLKRWKVRRENNGGVRVRLSVSVLNRGQEVNQETIEYAVGWRMLQAQSLSSDDKSARKNRSDGRIG